MLDRQIGSAYCTWTAAKKGGHAPYSHGWSGVLTGTGSSVSGNPPLSGLLNVQVTDGLGGAANSSLIIAANSGSSIFRN